MADGMEAECVKCVFERSINICKLRHVECLGDGHISKNTNAKDIIQLLKQRKPIVFGITKSELKPCDNIWNRGIVVRGRLTCATFDRLQNYEMLENCELGNRVF